MKLTIFNNKNVRNPAFNEIAPESIKSEIATVGALDPVAPERAVDGINKLLNGVNSINCIPSLMAIIINTNLIAGVTENGS